MKEVISKYHPDRILIEPSGVGKLSDVIKAVQGVEEETGLVLNSYTTVVDAKKCKMYMRNFGEFFNNQVEYAGAIIMSRTDIVDEAKAQASLELLREINSKAAIITTPIEKLEGKKLLEVMEHPVSLADELMEEEEVCPECGHVHEHGEHHHDHDHGDHCECGDHDHDHCECGHHHHHARHDDEIAAFVFESDRPFDPARLDNYMRTLTQVYGPDMLRYKGVLYMTGTDRKMIFQGVHMLMAADLGKPWGDTKPSTKMVFIGRRLPKKAIMQGLETCLA